MAELFGNPVVLNRADPWIYKHNGIYYFTATVPEYNRIELRSAKSIRDLNAAAPHVVWTKNELGPLSANIWAPEIHWIRDAWYIYFAAAGSSAPNDAGLYNHRIYVLENKAQDPCRGEWMMKGQVRTQWESFALDATTFIHKERQYLLWAQKDPDIVGNSNLYLATLRNPWTLDSDPVCISMPDFDWERIGYLVNEGPAVLSRFGKVFVTYSASATDHHYCMGLLVADEESDLMKRSSWRKSPVPVFQTDEESAVYGPGHNSFTVTEDGDVDLLVYHARSYKEIEGDPLDDPNRHTRVQPFRWTDEGMPDFGRPVPDGALLRG